MTTKVIRGANSKALFGIARKSGLALTFALLAGLLWLPEATLAILWNVAIPILPAVFMICPDLWRQTCPLATLNFLTGNRAGVRTSSAATLRVGWIFGMVLLFALVPARRFLFNTDAAALAITIAVVGALALAGGMLFSRRSGFCNLICPVLPVEKLYGQQAFANASNASCPSCVRCTERGCIDVAKSNIIPETVGRKHFLATSFGVFAAAFPGFVIGYFSVENVGLGDAPRVYFEIAVAAAWSLVFVAILSTVVRVRATTWTAILGGVSLALYYWFAAAEISKTFLAPDAIVWIIRALAIALVLIWAARTFRLRIAGIGSVQVR
ncbi:MAG: hypothetical protein NUW37_13545 [Planctomycetes bacterium]|nr:hypothetical protein [Planctomycetota bacterium]